MTDTLLPATLQNQLDRRWSGQVAHINAHETDYFIDSSVCLLEITADVALFLQSGLCDANEITSRNIPEEYHNGKRYYTLPTCRIFREEYLKWYDTQASAMDRAYAGIRLLYQTSGQFREVVSEVNDRVIANNLDGDLDAIIQDREILKTAFELEVGLAHWIITFKDSLHKAIRDVNAVNIDELFKYAQRYARQVQENLYNEHNWWDNPRVVGTAEDMVAGIQDLTFEDLPAPKFKTTEIIPDRKTRSAIKKSFRLFSNVIGEAPLKAFISGETITLTGKLFDYKISKSNGIINHTSRPNNYGTPYNLNIYSKDDKRLCKACVYFSDTPIIDQIVGLQFYIMSDNEEEFLRTANFYSRTDDYATNETIRNLEIKMPSTDALVLEGQAAALHTMDTTMRACRVPIGSHQVPHDVFMTQIVPRRTMSQQTILSVVAELCEVDEEIIFDMFDNDLDHEAIVNEQSFSHTVRNIITPQVCLLP